MSEEEEFGHWGLLLFFALCVLAMLSAYFLRSRKILFLHETGASIIIGGLAGVCIRYFGGKLELKEFSSFKRDVFMLLLLPQIIFESGYNMKRRNFFRNMVSVLLFALIGTLISTFVIGGGLILFSHYTSVFTLTSIECLLFGSMISATDPVSVLAIFKELGVDLDLYANVFGESVLNDAIAIVLVDTFLAFEDSAVTTAFVFKALGTFIGIFLGSFAIGMAIGLLSSLLFKHVKLRHHPMIESSLIFLFAWCTYFLCEDLDLSGIAGILACGIVEAHYAYNNLSPHSQKITRQAIHVIAFISETFVFIYLGLAIFCFEHYLKFSLIATTIFLCLISRFFNIIPLSFLNNLFKKKRKLTAKQQFLLWFSGLRGAVAFALSVDLGTENGDVILTTTLMIVLFTVFIFGGLTQPLVKKMNIYASKEQKTTKKNKGFLRFDRKYLKPFFTRAKYNPNLYTEKPQTVPRNPLEEVYNLDPENQPQENNERTGLLSRDNPENKNEIENKYKSENVDDNKKDDDNNNNQDNQDNQDNTRYPDLPDFQNQSLSSDLSSENENQNQNQNQNQNGNQNGNQNQNQNQNQNGNYPILINQNHDKNDSD
ncbi:sodium/hydrogen exchanger [Anaeramoeba ignava]|uniref:Sodium/hydrogen exchanger n=1 Tax=Anaeramoeba ignava TaxID=1746090 RepID=A0A9Q0LN19_ANAIG|nr:sodium/hydrogen exchanger [Anaeramoeba ignava]